MISIAHLQSCALFSLYEPYYSYQNKQPLITISGENVSRELFLHKKQTCSDSNCYGSFWKNNLTQSHCGCLASFPDFYRRTRLVDATTSGLPQVLGGGGVYICMYVEIHSDLIVDYPSDFLSSGDFALIPGYCSSWGCPIIMVT